MKEGGRKGRKEGSFGLFLNPPLVVPALRCSPDWNST